MFLHAFTKRLQILERNKAGLVYLIEAMKSEECFKTNQFHFPPLSHTPELALRREANYDVLPRTCCGAVPFFGIYFLGISC